MTLQLHGRAGAGRGARLHAARSRRQGAPPAALGKGLCWRRVAGGDTTRPATISARRKTARSACAACWCAPRSGRTRSSATQWCASCPSGPRPVKTACLALGRGGTLFTPARAGRMRRGARAQRLGRSRHAHPAAIEAPQETNTRAPLSKTLLTRTRALICPRAPPADSGLHERPAAGGTPRYARPLRPFVPRVPDSLHAALQALARVFQGVANCSELRKAHVLYLARAWRYKSDLWCAPAAP